MGSRGLFVQFEPRLSATAASADEWIPVRPGAEGFIALAIGRIIVEERLGHVGSHRPQAVLYQNVDVREMAAASDVPVETLRRLARAFADADRAVAIPGGYLAGQRNGFSSMLAVQALNLVVAQVGREGGVFLSNPGPTAALRQNPPVNTFDEVMDLIARMKAGEIDLLLIHGANPMYELPAAAGFAEAIARVPFVVSFSPFVDETAVWADLILPDHTYLESWGYQVPSPGADRPVVSSQQPVVRPLYDTLATADVLLGLAARLGGKPAEALPWPDEASYLEETVSELYGSSLGAYDARTPSGFWALWRQYGGWWSEKTIRREPELTEMAQKPLPISDPQFEGDPEDYPFHLYPYSSITLSDGRGANLPWLQETPDPMTTVQWGMWVELNPKTASSLGVSDNDVVQVESPHGMLEAPVVIYPGIRPDVVAIPVGQGHQDYGRFAQAVSGSNPLALVAPVTDPDTGALAWGATRVRLKPTGKKQILARLESLDGKGRESPRLKIVRRWVLVVDLDRCTGCQACVVACHAENNVPVVGEKQAAYGRWMHWIIIQRYWEGEYPNVKARFMPVMCQQCTEAPCEPVCPVFATYHNAEGLERANLQPLHRHALLRQRLPIQSPDLQLVPARISGAADRAAQPGRDRPDAWHHGKMHLLHPAHPACRNRFAG